MDATRDAATWNQTSEAYRGRFHHYACGMCALWRLDRMGITAYKVVGRSDDVDALTLDIRMASTNLSIARECASEAEYLARMAPHAYRDQVCPDGLNCYYPEVLFG